MKKEYIKLNNNDNHLSFGNFFRIVKSIAKNKSSAMQSELFCVLFSCESISPTTVNNYCVGYRDIADNYKQVYINLEKRYKLDNTVFEDIILKIINILDGVLYRVDSKKNLFINNNDSIKKLVLKLYNLAKNDKSVNLEFSNKLYNYINSLDYYNALSCILIYVVLYKKQPLYESELKMDVFERVLSDTSISSTSLEEYLSLKLREGINYEYSLKNLGESGNSYANFELGCNEFYGYFCGYPRYSRAFKYFKLAASLNHASSNYMIGSMYIKGLIGSGSLDDLKLGYDYLLKAYKLGNIAAINSIGNMYKDGIYPLKKSISKAKEFYLKASLYNYAYALNNLGKLEESKDINKAYEYYLKSANLKESWACNKVGEAYRLGILDKDMYKAFKYYNIAIESNYRTVAFYAYYNLAKYFYLNGYNEIEKDVNKAIEYLKIASKHNILDASIELFYIYIRRYLEDKSNESYLNVIKYKQIIESNSLYNDDIRIKIEKNMVNIKKYKDIDITILDS